MPVFLHLLYNKRLLFILLTLLDGENACLLSYLFSKRLEHLANTFSFLLYVWMNI